MTGPNLIDQYYFQRRNLITQLPSANQSILDAMVAEVDTTPEPTIEFDDENEDSRFWPYVGNLSKLAGRAMFRPYQKAIRGEPIALTPKEIDMMMDKVRGGIKNFGVWLDETLQNPQLQLGQMVYTGVEGVNSMMEMLKGEGSLSEKTGQLGVGILSTFIEPILTFSTGEKIVGEQILPATSPEMVEGALATGALPASIGTYMKISKILPAGTTIGASNRSGVLARNIAKEYPAQAAAGIVHEGLMNPDEVGVEMIMANLMNPIILATSAVGGLGATRLANKRFTSDFLRDNVAINSDAISSIPSAKQIAVTADTPIENILASIDALTKSDNWFEAGIRKVLNEDVGAFRFPGLTADQAQQVYKKYGWSILPEKPTKVIDAKIGPSYLKNGTHIYFRNPFDQLIAETSETLFGEISRKYNIPEGVIKTHKDNIFIKIKETNTEIATVSDKPFRHKTIESIPFPEPQKKLGVYFAKDGEMLVTSTPLTNLQYQTYSRSGYLPKEQVLYNGQNASIEKMAKTGRVVVRLRNGQLRSADLGELTKINDGTLPVWSQRNYNEKMVDDFMSFATHQENGTYETLVRRFFDKKGWSPEGTADFENFVYRTLVERNGLEEGFGPSIKGMRDLEKILENEANLGRFILDNKLDGLGYRISSEADGWRITNIQGETISKFKTLDEIDNFVRADFVDSNVPNLNKTSMPFDAVPLVNPNAGALKRKWIARIERTKLSVGTVLRRADRHVMDVASAAGVPELGASIARNMDKMMNAVDSFIQGGAQRLIRAGERLNKTLEKLYPEVRNQITKVIEHKTITELRNTLTIEQRFISEELYKLFKNAGGVEKSKTIYHKMINGNLDPKTLTPAQAEMVEKLGLSIREGIINDEKILRYIDALDNPLDITADQLMDYYNFSPEARKATAQAREFFEEGADLFGIDQPITGYAPWITRWKGVIDTYSKKGEPTTAFIHDLRRIGITPDDIKVTDIGELAYRYAKSGIHHRAPVAGGGTAGELLSVINKEIGQLAEFGSPKGIDIRNVRKWVDNFRGIPDPDAANVMAFNRQFMETFNMNPKGSTLDVALDAQVFIKLGARPILALRDMTSSFAIGSLYGMDLAFDIMRITPAKLRRIESLMKEGYLPQFDVKAMLARNAESKFSKATDIAMKLSLQPQVYKVIAGNAYIFTFDKTISSFKKANGNYGKLIKELGDLLDSNPKPIQKYFLDMAVKDPIEAARFLASSNAYNVANRFGRLNNPLGWQGKFGRVAGQFGSWSLNALTVMFEGIANSRDWQSATRKIARLTAINGTILGAGTAAGLNLNTWMVTPFHLVPGLGPTMDEWGDIQRGAALLFSPSERDREFGNRLIEGLGLGLTPILIKEMIKSAQIMEDEGDHYRAMMRGAGFKLIEE